MSANEAERRLTLETQRFGDEVRQAMGRWTDRWWWFIAVGVAWLVVSALVLRLDATSQSAIAALLGALFLASAVDEFFIAYVRSSWRWAHVLLGILFVGGAIWCFANPVDAFWAVAAVFGMLLVLRGTFDIVASTISRVVNPLWGLGLVTGILEILLGFWVSQQFFPARAVLVMLWVGFFAMFRGIQAIVTGFEIRSLRP